MVAVAVMFASVAPFDAGHRTGASIMSACGLFTRTLLCCRYCSMSNQDTQRSEIVLPHTHRRVSHALMRRSIHIPTHPRNLAPISLPNFSHILVLLGCSTLELLVIEFVAPETIYSKANAHQRPAAEYHEEDDKRGREGEAHVVALGKHSRSLVWNVHLAGVAASSRCGRTVA